MDDTDLYRMPEPERKPEGFRAPRLNFVPPPEVEEPKYASLRDRGRALAFDALVWVAILIPLAVLFGGIRSSNGLLWIKLGGPPFLLATVVWLVHMTWMELKHGASYGKRRRGLRVVMEDGGPVTPEAALLRNLLRFWDAFPYVVPYYVGYRAANDSRKRQRFGDRIAETIVVTAPQSAAHDDILSSVLPSLDPEPAPATKRRRRRWPVIVLAVLVIAGGAAAFVLLRGGI